MNRKILNRYESHHQYYVHAIKRGQETILQTVISDDENRAHKIQVLLCKVDSKKE